MKIAEASTLSGLSVDTIRFYEKSGLCPRITRGCDGQRRFSKTCVDWLSLLAALRDTGMPMREMRRFARLYQHGDATVAERKAVLQDHEQRLKERQAALERCADLLQYKLAIYDEILGEKA